MADPILPSRAIRVIDELVARLSGIFSSLPPELQRWLGAHYARFRESYAAADSPYAQGVAAAAFLEAVAQVDSLAPLLGELIDSARGRVTRGGRIEGDASLIDRLPPALEPPRVAARPPAPPPPAAPPPPPTPPPPPPVGTDMAWAEAPVTGGAPPDEAVYESAGPEDELTRGGDEVAAPAATPTITRYPNLDCQDQVIVGQRMSLYIQLLAAAPTPTAQPIVFRDSAPDQEPPPVEAVIRARGFDIEGSDTRTLRLDRGGDSEERVVLIPRHTGEQEIRVTFYQEGRNMGEIRRNVLVVDAIAPAVVEQPEAPPALALRLVPGALPPDVELRIMIDRRDPRTLYFEAHSMSDAIGYNHAPMGQITLQNTPLEMFQSIYTELTAFARTVPRTPEDAQAQARRMARLGNQLWSDLFPPELQAAYWRVRDRLHTIQITSDEPWIPWEIARPFRFDEQNQRIDDPFLCEQFAIARWLAGPGPADQVGVSRVRPVAPASSNLESVQAELAYLEHINQLRAGVMPETPYSDIARVLDLLENGAFNILHVAAHGNFDSATPDNSGIMLTGGALRPSDIVAMFGGARPRPLIFINACHGARGSFGLTGLGGWADRLVRRSGVAAFVGAAWEVTDRLALQFAEAFYEALIRDEKPIAEAFRLARCAVRDAEPQNSTWLAYVLYADPNACIEVSSS